MRFQNKIIFLLITALVPFSKMGRAQQCTPGSDFVVSAQGHYGFIMNHRSTMTHLIKGHISGAELNYIFRTDGAKSWQQIHKYPEIGICVSHLDLANPEQLGTLEALYPYLNLRINKLRKKITWNIRVGVGLGYLTRPFDRLENHKNNAIGSHINGYVNLRLNSVVMLSPSWRLDYGVGLTHASNGAIKTPNLGLNMATVNLGVGYVFGNKAIICRQDSIAKANKTWKPSVILVAGLKEIDPGGPRYSSYGLIFNMYRVIGHKSRMGGGLELSYNTATKQYWAQDSVFTNNPADMTKIGIKYSYAFQIERLQLPIDFGYYLFNRLPNDDMFFHRIGLRYHMSKHLIANVTLLTHWARADYFEWGLGYEF
jgi:hypothetical protein